MRVTNWGNYPSVEADLKSFSSQDELKALILNTENCIPRGLGRCYGDAALSGKIISTARFNRMLSFSEETGVLLAEAGTTLEEILSIFVPRGFFLPVTPGTKYVTLGGAVASNVHGKNHHVEGCFCDHLEYIEIMLSDGSIVKCSKLENRDLFDASCGGMGLTGIILRTAVRLKRIETSYIKQECIRTANIDEVLDLFEKCKSISYSVAWIDCLKKGSSLGRSVIMLGEHCALEELPEKHKKHPLETGKKPFLSVPFFFPGFVLNRFTVKIFDCLYYNLRPAHSFKVVPYEGFFYPLDSISCWNRIYGRRGFLQYQFVLPKEGGKEALKDIIKAISKSGMGSFLTVLKAFGPQEGLLTFPTEGYTLALDFPKSKKTMELLDALDKIVRSHSGKIYLAKDSRMSPETFSSGYSSLEKFLRIKREQDQNNKFSSLLSERLGIR